jgi:acetate---CoA ligase (ADP-forming) subunit beta
MVSELKPALLTEFEAKELLRKADIPVVDTRLARTKREAIALSINIGFPVVLKIGSPDIVHKSDAGGVKVGLNNMTQVSKAYREIITSIKQKFPDAHIEGVTVQKMASPGVELIVGMNKDPQFGPVLMFGLGGILVELINDVSFRVVPLTTLDAMGMIQEIKGYKLLKGYRNIEPVNIPAIADLILKVSDFVERNPQINELDLNPVFADKKGVLVVDARIVLEPA